MALNMNYIKDKYNKIIGYVRDDGDKLTGYSYKTGRVVGYYIKGSKLTLDDNGRIYAYGDAVTALVYNAAYD